MITWLCCGLCAAALGGQTGPRLSDSEFFAQANLNDPALSGVRAAVEKQDWPAARRAFAEQFRAQWKHRWLADRNPFGRLERSEPGDVEKILAHKFRYSSGQWYDLGPHIDWSMNPLAQGETATIEWSSQLNRHFSFRALAKAYQDRGDEKYAAEIVAQMLAWIAECPVLSDRSGNSPYHYAWETLNTAVRAGDTWPNAIDQILTSRSLTSDALFSILKSLVDHAEHLDRFPTHWGNWLTAESKALFIVGTLLPEFNEAKTWRRHAIERLRKQMDTDVYPDGMEIELALGYSSWVLANFSFVMDMARQNGRAQELPADFLSKLERMYDYLTYAVMPNGLAPGLNDARNTSPKLLLEKGFQYFPERQDFLWVATRGKSGARPTKTSVAFPYSGHYVMRSGWDHDARYLLFDAGPFGSGHQHEDKLQVIAYAYGRQLLLDAGSYMYDHSKWRRYVLSTRGHNTILVDGRNQNRRDKKTDWVLPQPFTPLDNTWVSSARCDYAVGRYDCGYGPEVFKTVAHKRAVVFVKPDYWVLVDTLTPQDHNEHRYESLFHLNAEEAAIHKDTQAVTTANDDDANVALWPLCTADLQAEIVKGLQEDPVQGWANDPWRPVPTAVFHAKGKGKIRLATIVYPLPPGKKSPIDRAAWLPVLADDKPADDAVAVEIRFANGAVHRLLVADGAGVRHRCGRLDTTAELYWSEQSGGEKSFHVP